MGSTMFYSFGQGLPDLEHGSTSNAWAVWPDG